MEEPRVEDKVDDQEVATQLLERALRLGHDKADADEWLHSSAVKTHMRRMDPSFSEKALGYRSFSDFLKSRDDIAELEETGHERLVACASPPPDQHCGGEGASIRASAATRAYQRVASNGSKSPAMEPT